MIAARLPPEVVSLILGVSASLSKYRPRDLLFPPESSSTLIRDSAMTSAIYTSMNISGETMGEREAVAFIARV